MLLSRDFVGYMAGELVKRLVASKMIETPSAEALTKKVRAAMQDEISIEDRLNEEVRQILTQYRRRYAARGRFLSGNVQESEGRTGPSAEADSPMTPGSRRPRRFGAAKRKGRP